jgi:hypothetical protein
MNIRSASAIVAAVLFATVSGAADQPFPPLDVVKGWVARYYPAVLSAPKLPDGVNLGFLVDRDLSVVEHSAIIHEVDEGVRPSDLDSMFPRRNFDPSTVKAVCFNAVVGKSPRHCVIWAQVKS